jgi:hypothetical protein
MFGTTVDTAIGLVLVFLLFAILVSTAMEIISGVFALRAKALENAIAKLIEDPQTIGFVARLSGMFGAHSLTATADKSARPLSFEDIWDHALIAGSSGNDHPSYVPAANFAMALMQQLAKPADGSAPGELTVQAIADGARALTGADNLKETLQTLIAQAGTDVNKLRAGIETWFDGAMDRLSGQYKRFTQIITFLVALALAVIFNVDTVHVARTLYAEPALRATLETAAEQRVGLGAPQAPDTNAAISNALADYRTAEAGLASVEPIGWPPASNQLDGPTFLAGLLGWLLTALAAMMGAPFWFGILNSLVNARNAGPKPTSSTSAAK